MAINRALVASRIREGVLTHMNLNAKKRTPIWNRILESKPSTKAFEEAVMMYGFGLPTTGADGAPVRFDVAGEGWKYSLANDTVKLAFEVTEEAIEDDVYGSLLPYYGRALEESFRERKEIMAANIFNYGFNSSYAYGDGKELFSTAHPNSRSSAGTYSNKLATDADISETTIEGLLTVMRQITNEDGKYMNLQAKALIVPVQNDFNARRIINSTLTPGSNNNAVNVVNNENLIPQGVIASPYLVDDDATFISTDCPDGLVYLDRRKFKMEQDKEFTTGNIRMKGSERYAIGVFNPRGCVGTQGA